MDDLALHFFPYPHVWKDKRRNGVSMAWPARCVGCSTRQCEATTVDGLQLCPYGVNFQRISEDLLVAGIVVRDYRPASDAYRKMMRRAGKDAIHNADLQAVVAKAAEATERLEADVRRGQRKILNRYRRSKQYQRDAVELLRPELQRTFGQVHDYKQFVQQVIQNLDVHLERQSPGLPIEEKLTHASHEETAIYWAARLMDEKLDASVLMLNPEQISDPRAERVFRWHGLVTKYLRIYQRRIEERRIRLHEIGGSYVDIRGNPKAIGIIPHAFIDNAVKYAPVSSDITISYTEAGQRLTFKVESLGPRIADSERQRIFDFYYRGQAARIIDAGGTGFGLAAAQLVAHEIGTQIDVTQSARPAAAGAYLTTFSVQLPVATASGQRQAPRDATGHGQGRRRQRSR